MVSSRLTHHLLLAMCLLASMAQAVESSVSGDRNEVPIGNGAAISVFRSDGTPARRVAPAFVASGARGVVARGGGNNEGGQIQILYVRVNFPDDLREWISKDEAYEACRGAADFHAENSYGQLQMSFDVTSLLTMPRSYLYYREVPNHVSNAGVPALVADGGMIARAAGYNPSNYDLLVVGHRALHAASSAGPPGTIQVQSSAWTTLAATIGNAIGAGQSVLWRADGTSSHGARDWRRFGISGVINNLYNDQVESGGDPWCIVGGGTGHMSLYWKLALGYLTEAQVPTISASGRYRVTAFDYPTLQRDRLYGFSIRRNNSQTYYAGYRVRQVDGRPARFPLGTERWAPDSLLLWGGPWDGSRANRFPYPYLIDTRPGEPGSLNTTVGTALPIDGDYIKDCGISVGRTWSDRAAGIHITVVDRVHSEPDALDVVVNLGTFPENRKPTVSLSATGGVLRPNGQYLVEHTPGADSRQLTFQATAHDADGDELAYYWDFGDFTNSSTNTARTTHAWSAADVGSGRLLTVRVVVSDMKGGIASAILPINIGLSEFPAVDVSDTTKRQKLWAKGRIVDQAGQPVEGMRVQWVGSPWRGTWTDSDGRYWLGQLDNGQHSFEARSESMYSVGIRDATPLPSPVRFSLRDVEQLDFVAYQRQTISVSADTPTIAPGGTATFTLIRSYATSGTFDQPASHTIPDLTSAGSQPLYVRLYYAGVGSNWRWNDPLTAPTLRNIQEFRDIPFLTPEDPRQERRETQVSTNPPTPDNLPRSDAYVIFRPGQNSVQVTMDASSMVPAWQRSINLMVAHSPDYYVAVDEATVIVQNPSPAAVPVATLGSSAIILYEGSGLTAQLRVTLDMPTPVRLEIPLVLSGVGASRVIATPAVMVVEPGSASATSSISVIDDTVVQASPETVTVALGAGTGYDLGIASRAIALIDNERSRVWITNIQGPARESGGLPGAFAIHREGNLAAALVVPIAVSGTAIAGVDYVALPTLVTIPAGLASVTLNLQAIADSQLEGDERVEVSLLQSNSILVANPASAVCAIQDMALPDLTVATVGSASIQEGGSATVRFTRTRQIADPLTVLFDLAGTASYDSNDYDIPQMVTRGRITIPAGAATYDIQINAGNDLVREITQQDSEYVFVQLLRSGGYNIVSGSDQAMVTIRDNDTDELAEVTMERPSITVREGDQFDIDIVWSDWPTEAVNPNVNPQDMNVAKVEYEIVEDDRPSATLSAVVGVNFVGVETTRVSNPKITPFNSQERRYHLNVATLHDGVPSADRTFLIRLSNPQNCVLPQVRAGSANLALCVVTIKDIDSGTVALSAPTPTAIAGTPGTPGLLRLTRSVNAPMTADALPVLLELRGAAVPGVDFAVFGSDGVLATYGGDATMLRQVTIPAGQMSLDIPIHALAPETERPDRILAVRIASAAGYDFSTAHASLTITSPAVDTRPFVSIAATQQVSYEETGSAMVFTVTRTGSTSLPLAVPFQLSSLSNAVSADLIGGAPAGVIIPAGATTATVQVRAVDDGQLEGTETVILALVAYPDAAFRLDSSNAATGWIVDASMPQPQVSVEVVQPTVQEVDALPGGSGAVGRFRLYRSGEQVYPLTVNLGWTGAATNGVDYAALPVTATIPAGSVSLDLDVTPQQDAIAEGDESVVLTVANGIGYEPKTDFATGTVTIIDDEAASVEIAQQGLGTEGGAAVSFLLTRSSSDLGAALTVNVALSGEADPTTDLSGGLATVPVTFVAGQATVVLNLAVNNDATEETDETVIATVIAGVGYVPGVLNQADSRILDNDRVRVSIALATPGDAQASENDLGAVVPATIRLTRSSTSGSLVVPYVVSGSAGAGTDYVILPGSVTFAAGQANADVLITPLEDAIIESPESVVLTIAAESGFNVDPDAFNAAVSIISDDELRVGVIGAANHKVGSPLSGTLTFRFYRIGSTAGPLRVNYTMGGTVIEGTDYAVGSGYVDIVDGAASADLNVNLFPGYDATERKSLTCTVDMPVLVGSYVPGNVTGITGGLRTATTQILKSTDTRLVRVRAATSIASEGGSDALLDVSSDVSFGTAQTLTLAQIPGVSTASAGSDYIISPTPVVLAAGVISGAATIDAPADYQTTEGSESALLALTQPAAVGLGDPAFWSVGLPALVTIADGPAPQPNIVVRLVPSGTTVGATDSLTGTQKVGTAADRVYSLVNTGSLALHISSLVLDPAQPPVNCTASLSTPTLPIVLNPGDTAVFTLTYTPSGNSIWSAGVRIDSDDPDEDPRIFRLYGIGGSETGNGGGTVLTPGGTAEGGACGLGSLAGILIALGMCMGIRRQRNQRR